jgi:hypothetical protein
VISTGCLLSGGFGVRHQLLQRAVADDAPRGQHVVRQPGGVRPEPGRPPVVDGNVAGHGEQGRRRGPPDRGDQQVAVDPVAAGHLHRLHAAAAQDADDVPTAPGILDVHDVHAGTLQVERGGVPLGVRGEYDGALPGPDRVEVDQPACRRGQQHPGYVVAGEDVGALDQSRCHHEGSRPRLDQTLADVRKPAL